MRARMGERFVNVWVLLSDTDRFVSRAGLMFRYENQLREWRSALNSSKNDDEVSRRIRDDIIAFRKARRLEGWELRLGSLDVQVKGFRSDEAMGVGFRRMVLMLGETGEIRYITGSANHVQLDEELQMRLRAGPPGGLLTAHYLWYRRTEGVIELAGADSEPRELFEHLIEYVDRHKSALVRALYSLT